MSVLLMLRTDINTCYPLDDMLARVIAIATCPSVCLSVCLSVCPSVRPSVRHAPVLCQNEETKKLQDFFTIW